MPARTILAALVASAVLSIGTAAGAAPQATASATEAHGHEHGHGTARLSLDHGRKWATDAPLRKGMSGIRAEMVRSGKAIHSGRLAAAEYEALAARVEAEIAQIVANCKLAPDADEQLHLVLTQLGEGVDEMKRGEHRNEGAEAVVAALNEYGRYFDHPGWKPIKH
ncbi:MAG TPA: hypothetical protein VN324_10410 [Quisquiliibacterium sp.]|nr:hypothetical protein [Quisquiliibacterium sp.]